MGVLAPECGVPPSDSRSSAAVASAAAMSSALSEEPKAERPLRKMLCWLPPLAEGSEPQDESDCLRSSLCAAFCRVEASRMRARMAERSRMRVAKRELSRLSSTHSRVFSAKRLTSERVARIDSSRPAWLGLGLGLGFGLGFGFGFGFGLGLGLGLG